MRSSGQNVLGIPGLRRPTSCDVGARSIIYNFFKFLSSLTNNAGKPLDPTSALAKPSSYAVTRRANETQGSQWKKCNQCGSSSLTKGLLRVSLAPHKPKGCPNRKRARRHIKSHTVVRPKTIRDLCKLLVSELVKLPELH